MFFKFVRVLLLNSEAITQKNFKVYSKYSSISIFLCSYLLDLTFPPSHTYLSCPPIIWPSIFLHMWRSHKSPLLSSSNTVDEYSGRFPFHSLPPPPPPPPLPCCRAFSSLELGIYETRMRTVAAIVAAVCLPAHQAKALNRRFSHFLVEIVL